MTYKNKIFLEEEACGEHFSDCQFVRCSFPGVNLRFTTFTGCEFNECDLSSIICEGTNFSKCSFPESKLSNLNLFSVKFNDCDFTKSILSNCLFESHSAKNKFETKLFNLSTCRFADTNLSGSVFSRCDLRGVTFQNSNLERATFNRCDLRKADFSQALMSGISFVDCKVEDTVLDFQGFVHFGNSRGFILGK